MIHLQKPEQAQHGDFLVFPRDDRNGRHNRVGEKKKSGFSGFVVVVVYDGDAWARLTLDCQRAVGVKRNAFAYRYDADKIVERTVLKLQTFCDAYPTFTVQSWWYGKRKYARLLAKPE